MPALGAPQQARVADALAESAKGGAIGAGDALRMARLGAGGELAPSHLSATLLASALEQLAAAGGDDQQPISSGDLLLAHQAFQREGLRALVGPPGFGGGGSGAATSPWRWRRDAADAYLSLCATHGPPPPAGKGQGWATPPQLIASRIALMLGHGVPGVRAADSAARLVSVLFRRLSAADTGVASGLVGEQSHVILFPCLSVR